MSFDFWIFVGIAKGHIFPQSLICDFRERSKGPNGCVLSAIKSFQKTTQRWGDFFSPTYCFYAFFFFIQTLFPPLISFLQYPPLSFHVCNFDPPPFFIMSHYREGYERSDGGRILSPEVRSIGESYKDGPSHHHNGSEATNGQVSGVPVGGTTLVGGVIAAKRGLFPNSDIC